MPIEIGSGGLSKLYLGDTLLLGGSCRKEYDVDITKIASEQSYSGVSGAWAGGFSFDGTKYFVSQNNGTINKYELNTPFDFSTYDSSKTQSISSSGQIHQVYINEDGTKLAYASYSSFVGIWDLTTPYDLSTATNHKTKSASSPVGIWFKPDGTRLYIGHYNSNGIRQYDLSTPRDITTATNVGGLSTGSERGVTISSDGTVLIRCDSSNNNYHTLYQYILGTPRDITSVSSSTSISWDYHPAMVSLTLDDSRLTAVNWIGYFNEKTT